jgi:methionyl-tRNA synthetase
MSGSKASTSRGHAIWVKDFLDRYEPDALRYYLTAAGPETQDSDFTWEEFVRRTNDELLANWGNLVNRTLVNAHRNFGAVPEPGAPTEGDRALLDAAERAFDTVGEHIKERPLPSCRREAATKGSRTSTSRCRLVARETDRDRAVTVLYVALRVVDSLKTLFTPFLPFGSRCCLGCSATGLDRPARSTAAPSRGDDGSTRDPHHGDYAAGSAPGRRESCHPARRCEPRPLSSASSTPGSHRGRAPVSTPRTSPRFEDTDEAIRRRRRSVTRI